MRRVDIFKLTLAGAAAVALFWGTRTDAAGVRWAGVALLAAAVLLRFVRPRRRE